MTIAFGTAVADNWGWISPIVMGIVTALLAYHGAMLAINIAESIHNGLAAVSAAAAALQAGKTLAQAAATTTATGAQVGLNAALLACPITWVVVGVIALIAAFYAAVAAVNHFAGTSVSATGMIAGAFAVLGAHVINTFVVPFWNGLTMVANFLGNVFNNPAAAVEILIYDSVREHDL